MKPSSPTSWLQTPCGFSLTFHCLTGVSRLSISSPPCPYLNSHYETASAFNLFASKHVSNIHTPNISGNMLTPFLTSQNLEFMCQCRIFPPTWISFRLCVIFCNPRPNNLSIWSSGLQVMKTPSLDLVLMVVVDVGLCSRTPPVAVEKEPGSRRSQSWRVYRCLFRKGRRISPRTTRDSYLEA